MEPQKKFYQFPEFWFAVIFLVTFFFSLKVEPISLGFKWEGKELTTSSLAIFPLLASIFFAYLFCKNRKEGNEDKLERLYLKALDDKDKLIQQLLEKAFGNSSSGGANHG